MTRARNYFAWQSRLVLPEVGRRVVEAGCGIGNFTGALLDRDLVLAADNEPDCVEALRRRYPNRPNLLVCDCEIESPCFLDLARHNPDSCVCLNVLEHVEHDQIAMERMASILTPAGVIVLLVPAFPALYGPIDRKLDHFRRYTRADVLNLARRAGLEIHKLRYVNMAGFFGWWINARLLRRTAQSEAQIEVFDRLIVPAMSRLERLLPPPFGQSLFAVLRKRG